MSTLWLYHPSVLCIYLPRLSSECRPLYGKCGTMLRKAYIANVTFSSYISHIHSFFVGISPNVHKITVCSLVNRNNFSSSRCMSIFVLVMPSFQICQCESLCISEVAELFYLFFSSSSSHLSHQTVLWNALLENCWDRIEKLLLGTPLEAVNEALE